MSYTIYLIRDNVAVSSVKARFPDLHTAAMKAADALRSSAASHADIHHTQTGEFAGTVLGIPAHGMDGSVIPLAAQGFPAEM